MGGKPFQDVQLSFPDWVKGCFLASGAQTAFNSHPVGGVDGKIQAVCRLSAAFIAQKSILAKKVENLVQTSADSFKVTLENKLAKAPSDTFIVGDAAGCPDGAVPIEDKDECAAAGLALGKPFQDVQLSVPD